VVAKAARASIERLGSHVERAREEFAELEKWLRSPATLNQTFDEVEGEEERRGREVRRILLPARLGRHGPGDVAGQSKASTAPTSGRSTRSR
jgi:hypothetical protein